MKRCLVCGEEAIVQKVGEGRRTSHKNLVLEVPADLAIPTCTSCGTEWIDDESAKRIDAALELVYRKHMSSLAVEALDVLSAFVRQGELERQLGLAQGYLTKVKKGHRTPSALLATVLATMALDPSSRLQDLNEVLSFGFTFRDIGLGVTCGAVGGESYDSEPWGEALGPYYRSGTCNEVEHEIPLAA